MFDTLSLDFIGKFYAIICGAVVLFGLAIFAWLYVTGNLKSRYKDYSIFNDIMLLAIWVIGFGGAWGVLQLDPWGQFLLQLFCWMLIALVMLSAGSRLYTVHKLGHNVSRGEWVRMGASLAAFVLPIIFFSAATILTLRSDEARAAFGIP